MGNICTCHSGEEFQETLIQSTEPPKREKSATNQSFISDQISIHEKFKVSRKASEINANQSQNNLEKKSQFQNVSVRSSKLDGTSGKEVGKHYFIGTLLGEGSNSVVLRIKHKILGDVRALKRIDKDYVNTQDEEKGLIQINILKDLDHPNIQRNYEYFEDHKFTYIVSEYYEGGDLLHKVQNLNEFTEKTACHIMQQLLRAVDYLHQNKIVHRDIKPEKILFNIKNKNQNFSDSVVDPLAFDELKLIGFGEATNFLEGTYLSELVGTPYYIAPEVLSGKYNEKCDIWSCGVVLAIIFTGEQLFQGQNAEEIIEQVQSGDYNLDTYKLNFISEQGKAFLKKLLTFDYRKRISAAEALKDEWFTSFQLKRQADLPSLKNNLESLMRYKRGKILVHAIRCFLIENMISTEEKQQLQKTFSTLDTNGDGKLSKQEILEGYKKIGMDQNVTSDQLEQIFKNIDDNGNGCIDFMEWTMATINLKKIFNKDKLQKAFKLFDDDSNGYITKEELLQIFSFESDNQKANELLDELLKEIDDNSDGKISYQEFITGIQAKIQDE